MKKKVRENAKELYKGKKNKKHSTKVAPSVLLTRNVKSLPREFIAEMRLTAQGPMAPANYSHEQPHRICLKDSSMCGVWLTVISDSKLQGEKG